MARCYVTKRRCDVVMFRNKQFRPTITSLNRPTYFTRYQDILSQSSRSVPPTLPHPKLPKLDD